MKYIIYHLWIISLLFPLGMQAKVRLTSIWGDNMVLQQQSEVTFHGKASANSKITIEASWNHRKLTTRSDQHGNWNIQLPTPAAGGPYTITFSDGEALTLNNILLGEVWFCSGQSNMEMPVRGFRGTAGLWFTTLYRSCRLQTGITFVYSQKRLEHDS